MIPSILARGLYFCAQAVRGEPVLRVARELEKSQRWPLERLEALQWDRLRSLYSYAITSVPGYRDRWTQAGLTPDSVRTREDWSRVPALEKSELRLSPEANRAPGAHRGVVATTSGSSGTPIAVLRDHLSWAHAHGNLIRAWKWHGIRVGDPYAYFWGLALDKSGRKQAHWRDLAFNRRRLSAFGIDAEGAARFHRALMRDPVSWGFGYPSAVTDFAAQVRSQGLDGRALKWKAVITTAEVLRPHQRELMEDVFGCSVVDSYGCAEVGVTGFECPSHSMHIPIESVAIDLEPAEDGLWSVLLTDLHNRAAPVIRYRVGDLVGPSPGPCPCGLALPVLGPIQGRAGDHLLLPDGRRVNGLLPYYVFRPYAKSRAVLEYQFIECRDRQIELRIRPGESWSESLADQIRADVEAGLGVAVRVRTVTRIQRQGRGKHRDFVKESELEGD